MPVSSCCQPVGDGELHIHSQSLHSMGDSVWGKLAACPAQFAKGNQWLHGLESGCAILCIFSWENYCMPYKRK